VKLICLAGGCRESDPAPGDTGAGLLETARGLATNAQWFDMVDPQLVVRLGPRPLLGVLGSFDAAAEYRLAWLRRQLQEPLPRQLTYADVEEDCEILAEGLVSCFGLNDLRGFHFRAIPRGGLIVLGILSYRLNLNRSQFDPHTGDAPLVLVDDVSLTGLRFGQWLRRCGHERVIFAHLYSPPAMRAEALKREPRLQACISAHDLHDDAPERLGAGYTAWREDRLKRLAGPRYWVGQTEGISFPWSQPDHQFGNPVTQERESGWSIALPSACLRNRSGCAIPAIPVQVQPEGRGSWRIAPSVLFGQAGGQCTILDVESNRSFALEGVAADMWYALLDNHTMERAAAFLVERYDADLDMIRSDLREFERELTARGVLEHAGSGLVAV
jgi:hypothetical protein